jgi:hypothetical protein
VCSLELSAGYGVCGPAEFRAAHAREAAGACVAAAQVLTGVNPVDGAWAAAGTGAPNKTSDRAPGVVNKLDNPFESPYHNPHDNPNWNGWGSPYGSPWNPSPWSRPGGYGGGGYNPYIPYNPYTNNPGGNAGSGGYVNGQVYQFYGRWYRYDNGRWTQVEGPSSTGSGSSGSGGYSDNQWYQIDGQWYMYNGGNWYQQRDGQWCVVGVPFGAVPAAPPAPASRPDPAAPSPPPLLNHSSPARPPNPPPPTRYMFSDGHWYFYSNGTYYYYENGQVGTSHWARGTPRAAGRGGARAHRRSRPAATRARR